MSVVVVVPDWSSDARTGAEFVEQMIVRELATLTDVHLLVVRDHSREPILKHPAATLSICPRRAVRIAERLFGPLPTVALWSRGEDAQGRVREMVATHRASHVLVSRLYAAVNVPSDVQARLLVLAHNVEHRRIRTIERMDVTAARHVWLRLQARRMQRLERRVLRRAAALLAISPLDAAILATMVHPGTTVITLPVVPDRSLLGLPMGGRPGAAILFVGSLGYRPNLETAVQLVQYILPKVRLTHPHAKLLLAGSDPPAELQHLMGQQRDVEVMPNFNDLADVFGRATVFVAPLARQEGVSIKTLNALASGTPVVATPAVLASLGAKPGVHALAAEESCDFVRAVTTLLDNAALRLRIASAAREFVTLNFSQQLLHAAMRSALSIR